MGRDTGISWTNSTWNPIRGCSRVSTECINCYAESVAHRFSGPGLPYEGLVRLDADGKSTGQWNGKINFIESHLLDPLKWKEPRRIFVNSMSDMFHENLSDDIRDKVFGVGWLARRHTLQILTKRPEIMARYVSDPGTSERINEFLAFYTENLGIVHHLKAAGGKWNAPQYGDYGRMELAGYWEGLDVTWPLPNAHMGVSVGNVLAKKRIDILRDIPAAVRFISAEPLLESLGTLDLRGIDWVIIGGESGAEARPFEIHWAEEIIDQCKAAGVAVFMKQLGSNAKLDGCKFETNDRHGADPSEWFSRWNVQEFPSEVA